LSTPPVYLDNNATTFLDPEVADAMARFQQESDGNPSSIHAVGRRARNALDTARETVASVLGARPREVVFTGSGSEADTLAVVGSVLALREKGAHLVVGAVEHAAVLAAARFCARHFGVRVTEVAPDADGRLPAEAMIAALEADTLLVSMMAANNETGALMPVEAVGAACRERGIRFHVDAVQLVGKAPVRFDDWPVDLLALSAHKFHGPKGVGALLVRRGVRIEPLIQGGGQERGLRPGTENVAGIVGLARALELCQAALAEGAGARMAGLRDRLEAELCARVPDLVVNGPTAPDARVVNTTNVSFPGAEAEGLLIALDRAGICASSGSACSSGSLTPSHVLTAMRLSHERIASSLRLSLCRFTTDAEIDRLLEILPPAVSRLRLAA
jgi:cysteine desulfurase